MRPGHPNRLAVQRDLHSCRIEDVASSNFYALAWMPSAAAAIVNSALWRRGEHAEVPNTSGWQTCSFLRWRRPSHPDLVKFRWVAERLGQQRGDGRLPSALRCDVAEQYRLVDAAFLKLAEIYAFVLGVGLAVGVIDAGEQQRHIWVGIR